MIFSDSESTIDFSKMEYIPECDREFPAACYEYDLFSRTEPWHWHDEFEAAVIESGTARLMLEGEEYILKEGNAYFVNSGILHSLTDIGKAHCMIRCAVFRKELVGGFEESVFYRKYLVPLAGRNDYFGGVFKKDVPWQEKIIDDLEQVFGLFRNENEGFEYKTRELLTDFCAVTVKNLPPYDENRGNTVKNYVSGIKKMLLYIWQNYQKSITLSDIANAGMVSKNECMLCFGKTVETSPIQYLKNYRLQKAKEMLLSTDKKVTEISELCGFADKSYFTRAFQEKFGESPLKFRKAAK